MVLTLAHSKPRIFSRFFRFGLQGSSRIPPRLLAFYRFTALYL